MILAGGEILLDPVREPVLYPAIDLLHQKYRKQGGVKVIIQTTGDVLNSRIAGELLERKVWMISVSGMDAYHEGLEEQQARDALQQKLTAMFESLGMKYFDSAPAGWGSDVTTGPYFHFFGATPDSWIGKLWPRGRAQANQLSTAGIMDNFCNRWSGGLEFLVLISRGLLWRSHTFPCAKSVTVTGIDSEVLQQSMVDFLVNAADLYIQ